MVLQEILSFYDCRLGSVPVLSIPNPPRSFLVNILSTNFVFLCLCFCCLLSYAVFMHTIKQQFCLSKSKNQTIVKFIPQISVSVH